QNLVVVVVAVKKSSRPPNTCGGKPLRSAEFPTNFHTKQAGNTVRKAFARSQKRVKYAAADQGPEEGLMSATGTAREESQSMEFSVTKSALLNELTTTQGVVERKTTIPILSNLLIEAREGRVTITATDLELSIRTSCEA